MIFSFLCGSGDGASVSTPSKASATPAGFRLFHIELELGMLDVVMVLSRHLALNGPFNALDSMAVPFLPCGTQHPLGDAEFLELDSCILCLTLKQCFFFYHKVFCLKSERFGLSLAWIKRGKRLLFLKKAEISLFNYGLYRYSCGYSQGWEISCYNRFLAFSILIWLAYIFIKSVNIH